MGNQWVFVFVALGIRVAMRMRRIVVYDLRRCIIFFHIISQTTPFSGGKKVTEYKMCVLILPTIFVWNIYNFKKNYARYNEKCTPVFM
jgi:hypothetical protein